MNAADFRRIAVNLESAEEGSHLGAADFRLGGRILATLASQQQGYGNSMLTRELHAKFRPGIAGGFLPVPGGWGRTGMTHVRLAQVSGEVLSGALRTAWKLRIDKNKKTKRRLG